MYICSSIRILKLQFHISQTAPHVPLELAASSVDLPQQLLQGILLVRVRHNGNYGVLMMAIILMLVFSVF